MNNIKKLVAAGTLSLAAAACHATDVNPASELSGDSHQPVENLITGGQPSKEDLVQLKDAGITTVINLRPTSESIDFDEKQEAEALGLEYVALPVSGAADITVENAEKLHQLLARDQPVFLHCASGNRVGALLAIRAHAFQGKSEDESLALGRAAGLSSLEEKVKAVFKDLD